MDCILHIGIGKAGSSTIEAALQDNRAALLERGTLYPEDLLAGGKRGGDNHKCLAVACMRAGRDNIVLQQHRRSDPDGRKRFDADVRALYAEQLAASQAERCLLSAEHFWSVLSSPAEIARLARLLADLGLRVGRIVVYLRRQSDWFESIQFQRLREGRSSDFAMTAEAALADGAAPALDYASVLARWRGAFPHARLVPRLFERESFVGGSLLSDFFDAAGIDGAGSAAPQDRNIGGLSNLGLNLLREINRHLPPQDGRGRRDPARNGIVDWLGAYVPGRARVMPPQEMAAIDRHYAASNEVVRAAHFPDRAALFPPREIRQPEEAYAPISDPHFPEVARLLSALWRERGGGAAPAPAPQAARPAVPVAFAGPRKVTFFGASVTEQSVHHATGEVTGFVDSFERDIAPKLEIDIDRVSAASSDLSEAATIYVERVRALAPDICILDWVTPLLKDCDIRFVEQIYLRLLEAGIYPVTIFWPRKDRVQKDLPLARKMAQVAGRWSLPVIDAAARLDADLDRILRDVVHTNAEGARIYARLVEEVLAELPARLPLPDPATLPPPPFVVTEIDDGTALPFATRRLVLEIEPPGPAEMAVMMEQRVGPYSPVLDILAGEGDGTRALGQQQIWDVWCYRERLCLKAVTPWLSEIPGRVDIRVGPTDPNYAAAPQAEPMPEGSRHLKPRGGLYLVATRPVRTRLILA